MDVAVANASSPITNIDLAYSSGGGGNTHAAIFAASGTLVSGLAPFRITFGQFISATEFKITWESVSGKLIRFSLKTHSARPFGKPTQLSQQQAHLLHGQIPEYPACLGTSTEYLPRRRH